LREKAVREANASTCTEWSITSSAGISGLIFAGSPPRAHRVAHRREVDEGGDARQVLHQHATRGEGDLLAWLIRRDPAGDGLDVLVVSGAQDVLEQDSQRVREAGDVVRGLQRVESEDLVALAAHAELGWGGHALDSTRGTATRVGATAPSISADPCFERRILPAAVVYRGATPGQPGCVPA